MIARRICPSSYIRDIHHLVCLNYPMFDEFIPEMIRSGVYQIKDDTTGEIMPPKKALKLLEVNE